MSGVIPDGLQMDSLARIPAGVPKTADTSMQVDEPDFEPVAGFEPGDLPFTRQREVVPLRAAPIPPVRKCQVSAGRTHLIRAAHAAPRGSETAARWSYGLRKDSHPAERGMNINE